MAEKIMSVRMPESMVSAIEETAKKEYCSNASVIKRAVAEYLHIPIEDDKE